MPIIYKRCPVARTRQGRRRLVRARQHLRHPADRVCPPFTPVRVRMCVGGCGVRVYVCVRARVHVRVRVRLRLRLCACMRARACTELNFEYNDRRTDLN